MVAVSWLGRSSLFFLIFPLLLKTNKEAKNSEGECRGTPVSFLQTAAGHVRVETNLSAVCGVLPGIKSPHLL